jgi:hypothetical protein
MDALVIDGLEPRRELGVEIGEVEDGFAGEAQGGFEVLLNGEKEAFDLPLRPTMKRFGVEESDAQAGTNHAGVVVGEGAALIGVELEGKTAAAVAHLWRSASIVPGLDFGARLDMILST